MSGTWQWLMLPLSGAPQHAIEPWAYWHARCMVASWGVLLPIGALLARYFKVPRHADWPRVLDHKAWWHGHRALQWGGALLMSAGAALAFGQARSGGSAALVHAWIGWAVIALGWFQVVAGLVRGSKGGPTSDQMRGDHYDMTPYRRWFERLHKSLGWLSIVAAWAVLALGLLVADAPRWMALAIGLWWACLGCAAWHWQGQGRCIDTYQAIWGPDPRHPGNRLRPIGWGVRRLPH